MLESRLLLACGALFFTALASLILRSVALKQMRRVSTNKTAGNLHPAELAYLIRPGDSAHCLIVLLVDAVQKGLKSQAAPGGLIGATGGPAGAGGVGGAGGGGAGTGAGVGGSAGTTGGAGEVSGTQLSLKYETEIWSNVKDYIRDWSTQQAQKLIPELRSKNPIKIISGLWRFRLWLWNALTGLLDEIIKDPRHLRKYFSPVGLIKLFVSVAGAGVKDKLANEVRDNLRERDLLISEKRRGKFALLFSFLAFLQLCLLIAIVGFYSGIPSNHAATVLVVSAFNGLVLRVLFGLPALLPYYGDIAQVLDFVKKKGIRITILRTLLKTTRGLYLNLIVLLSCVLCVVQALIVAALFSSPFMSNLFAVLALTLNFTAVVELFFQAFQISNTEQLSVYGQAQLEEQHAHIQQLKLTEILSTALSSPDYDQELSKLVAVYGVETLFLIA